MIDANKQHHIRLLKEIEIRDDVRKNRERFMLEKARGILNRNGFQALNLPELAQLSGYSKPTITNISPIKKT
ncbi:MAG: hypothetical protein KKB94_08840 [Proteobacteria bacterium]|nr:hypothetical protein [Pseudomonadota bacterium]